METWGKRLLDFYTTLQPSIALPNEVQWLYPQRQPEVVGIMQTFFQKYFNDSASRTLLLGINPGRFGAGVTGVNFTAPKQLTQFCGIEHHFGSQSELSAEFIYDVVNAYG